MNHADRNSSALAGIHLPLVQPELAARGSGTRVLFSDLINQAGLPAEHFSGYTRTEPTHLAAAAAVAAGEADAAFGVAAAASHYDLAFVPLLTEQYFLICQEQTIDTPQAHTLTETLHSEDWQRALRDLPGYSAQDAGEVVSLRRTLP
ncbi:MAG: substrate-binding domain-containing protein [Burkholderiaceae bacterium]